MSINIISTQKLQKFRDPLPFARGFDLKNVTVESNEPGVLAEFIGTGDQAHAWNERRRYELASGALEEPLLYESIYTTEVNNQLPMIMPIFKTGNFGVVMQLVVEGGEAKAMSMSGTDLTVRQQQYAVLLQYTKLMRMYNMLNLASNAERAVGVATNALLNHAHFAPILTATYGSDNQTAGSSVGDTLAEKYMNTLGAAIENSTAEDRRGPYDLIVTGANSVMVKRVLFPVPQQGITIQLPDVLGDIENVIVYRGWSGAQGLKTTTYAAPTAGTAYLVDKSHKMDNFYSMMKQPLMDESGNADVSRFIEEQTVWDIHFGVTALPLNAVEEITWPTS